MLRRCSIARNNDATAHAAFVKAKSNLGDTRTRRLRSPAMKKIPFGRTGLDVSVLGYGAAPIGYLATEQEKVTRILNLLLDQGVNLIDTAASYKGSEEMIAKAIGHRRSEFVLVSKCG